MHFFPSFPFSFFGPLFAPRQHPLAPTPHHYGQATCVALREDTALCTARQTKPRVAQRRRRRRRRLLGTCFLSAADLKGSWVPPCPRRRKRTGRWGGSGLRGAAAAGGSGRNPGACGRVCCGEKDLVRFPCDGWDTDWLIEKKLMKKVLLPRQRVCLLPWIPRDKKENSKKNKSNTIFIEIKPQSP